MPLAARSRVCVKNAQLVSFPQFAMNDR